MSSKRRERFAPLIRLFGPLRSGALIGLAALAALAASCGGGDLNEPNGELRLSTIVIDSGSREIEIDTSFTLTATAKDTGDKTVTVPFVWRSSADSIVTFERDGKLVARDTGIVSVTASALGVTSAPIGIRVAFRGAAKIQSVQFNPPLAISPNAQLTDSIRVLVTTQAGGAAVGNLVKFEVAQGGGSVSPAIAPVRASGLATAKWTMGPAVGQNSIIARVLRADSTRATRVRDSATFTAKAYAALTIVDGDAQTANVLSALPVAPSVRLVDSAGRPRPGIPVAFTATANGRVASSFASTSSEGIASPGVWTLGDAQGDQQLIATVESAKITLRATATGSTVRFSAAQVATTQTATCTLTADQFASCFGTPPQIGTGDTTRNRSSPTLTKGGIQLTSLVGGGGGAHFCGTGADLSIYCWGINSFVDTTGLRTTSFEPTRLQSNIAWLQVTPGGQHNCALANDRSAYCWGIDTSGQLGDNGITRRYVPQPVAGGFKFASLAAGSSHQCGITTDGLAFCWGLNASGQVGDGTTGTTRRTPTAVSGGLYWKTLGAGAAWTCGLTQSNIVQCWGAGTGRSVPAPYNTPLTFPSLSVGNAHACALTGEGKAYCWGDNSSGQLGDSTTTNRDLPTEVATELRFTSISAGVQHTCGITTDRFVACWGRNTVGEIGVDTPLVQVTPRFVVIGVKP